ncbi:hypothetical protein HU200_017868 [Digitaria exilis]|uniref:Cupin type-1 domain-containing protein n=1 Tax=Digitaria exilis TaxID=1010633 RepID=A0A835F4Z1_9POAL|nr:hypothetical protein HU200_017868 [Digitaria exilis]
MDRVSVMAPLLMLLLLASRCAAAAAHRHGREWGWEEGEGEWRPEKEEEGEGKGSKGLFVLDRLEKVVESEGGQVGYIYEDELVERKLKMGDVLHIDAGSTFYMINTGKGQRLQIICSIDASDSLGFGAPYQSFFLGGAGHPASVLGGFEPKTLAATYEELARVLLAQTRGPIVYYATEPGSGEEGNRGARCRDAGAWRPGGRGEEDDECGGGNDARPTTWSWRKLVNRFIGGADSVAAESNRKKRGAPKPYNLYDSKPGFRNTYGWTIAVDKHAYEPLKHSDIGVYLVNLTAVRSTSHVPFMYPKLARSERDFYRSKSKLKLIDCMCGRSLQGSMLAPHVNPRATEYGVVLGGEGKVEVVFPNGSLAMSAVVRAGDVFWVPRYFPFCQVAATGGAFEFFGFTTSARSNRPQFLVGATSVLRTMLGPEVAAAFGAREEDFRKLVRAQEQALILPSFPEKGKREKRGKKGRGEEEEHGKGRKEEPLVIEQVAKE